MHPCIHAGAHPAPLTSISHLFCTGTPLHSNSHHAASLLHQLHLKPCPDALNPLPPRYARDVEDLVHYGTSGQVAAFFSETIQGVGGALPLADGYLPEVYKVGGGVVVGQLRGLGPGGRC
jgi:4-aminobutyrate aminotransferase-like enzyme